MAIPVAILFFCFARISPVKKPLVATIWIAGSFTALLGVYALFPDVRLALRGFPTAESVQKRVDPHIYDPEWFDAARAGRFDILGALLDAHFPINAQTRAGYTALILSAYDDQPAALAFLIQRGADVCLADKNGNTALMGALYKGEMDIAYTLVAAGCPIDQTNNAGETALAFAALFGHTDIIPLLVKHGANLDHRDSKGKTAHMIAVEQGNARVVDALNAIKTVPATSKHA